MLPQQHRLILRQEQDFFGSARKQSTQHATIFYRGNDVGHPRGAVVVPKKMSPSAARRNRLKRQTRALLATLFARYPLQKFDIVVYIKTTQPDLLEVVQQIERLFSP